MRMIRLLFLPMMVSACPPPPLGVALRIERLAKTMLAVPARVDYAALAGGVVAELHVFVVAIGDDRGRAVFAEDEEVGFLDEGDDFAVGARRQEERDGLLGLGGDEVQGALEGGEVAGPVGGDDVFFGGGRGRFGREGPTGLVGNAREAGEHRGVDLDVVGFPGREEVGVGVNRGGVSCDEDGVRVERHRLDRVGLIVHGNADIERVDEAIVGRWGSKILILPVAPAWGCG